MGKLNALLTGAVVGAGAMYFFDPRLGNRRRSLAQDQLHRLSRKATDGLDAALRDLGNRAQGLVAEAEAMAFPTKVSDDVLCQRVRSVAGRHMSNVSALKVDAADGHVRLRGPILACEAPGLVSAIRWTRGVRGVDNQLTLHGKRGDTSALQGEGRWPGSSIDFLQENWAPGTRLVAGTVGSLLMANCAACRGRIGSLLLGAVGLGLLTRSIANLETGRMLGMRGGRRAIDIHKTIEIHAPADQVFEFFSNPENLMKISDVITDVRVHGGGRFTKEMNVGGVSLRFAERFTRFEPNGFLETRSESDSMIQYFKQFRFERSGEHATRLHVLFSYNPVGGVLTHTATAALGYDPKSLLDDLLMRAKTYLETGRQPHDAPSRQHARSPVGTSAPVGDTPALVPRGEEELKPRVEESTWPPSPMAEPRPGQHTGPFPPAM